MHLVLSMILAHIDYYLIPLFSGAPLILAPRLNCLKLSPLSSCLLVQFDNQFLYFPQLLSNTILLICCSYYPLTKPRSTILIYAYIQTVQTIILANTCFTLSFFCTQIHARFLKAHQFCCIHIFTFASLSLIQSMLQVSTCY